MRPKKRLGQHFLVNVNAARRIASALDSDPILPVLEIGGGRGDLTVHLLAGGPEVTCVEFDSDMIEMLMERFAAAQNFRLLRSDILEFQLVDYFDSSQQIRLVGNLPYNITSAILEWIVDNRASFPQAVIMIQSEVADRVAAVPGGKEFGSLTVFVQLFFTVEKLFELKPGSFQPPPKVSSTVLKLTRRAKPLIEPSDFPALRRLTSACFRWRRKQLIRILRDEYSLGQAVLEGLLQKLQIDPTLRPEQLPVESFVALSGQLSCLVRDSESSGS